MSSVELSPALGTPGSGEIPRETIEFRIHKGPVFTNLLLADEINRAAPKVQSALFALAEDVVLHRIRLSYESLADGMSGQDVLQEILGPFGAAPVARRAVFNGRAR